MAPSHACQNVAGSRTCSLPSAAVICARLVLLNDGSFAVMFSHTVTTHELNSWRSDAVCALPLLLAACTAGRQLTGGV